MAFSGGSGTIIDPYLISNIDDLNLINSYMEEGIYFKQTTDINIGTFVPIGGTSSTPTNFLGSYDGNSFSLKNGTIYYPSLDYVGIFRYVKGKSNENIKNLFIKNVQVTGNNYVGCAIGYGHDGGTSGVHFKNINTDASCSVTANVSYAGGIVGTTLADISICSNKATVFAISDYVGGICGASDDTAILNCYNHGNITGRRYVGGITGYIICEHGTVNYLEYCYNSGNIAGTKYVGGIVGCAKSYYAFSGDRTMNVRYNYALNSTITRSSGIETSFGRIVGAFEGNKTKVLAGNYALDTMSFIY